MKTAATLILAALMVAAASANLHMVDFGSGSEERTLAVKSGDLVRITLEENPTTGYAWKYEDPFTKNTGVYSVQMDDFTQEEGQGGMGMAGVKGSRTIVIKAEKAGSEDFELVYVRSWEYKDFVETKSAANGAPVAMKEVPNEGYRKISITVSE